MGTRSGWSMHRNRAARRMGLSGEASSWVKTFRHSGLHMSSSWDFWGQCETNYNTLRGKDVSVINFGNHFEGSRFFTKLSYLTLTTSRMWADFIGLCQVSGLGREAGLRNWIIKAQPVTADRVETPWSHLVPDFHPYVMFRRTYCTFREEAKRILTHDPDLLSCTEDRGNIITTGIRGDTFRGRWRR